MSNKRTPVVKIATKSFKDARQVKSENSCGTIEKQKQMNDKLKAKIDKQQTKTAAAKTMNGENHIQFSDEVSDE